MKKKIKIFSTIASLCLAVALMAFGVYAATNVSYNVTSTITFDAADVFVTINATAYKDADGNTTGAETLDTATEYKSYTGTNPMVPNNAGEPDTLGEWKPAIALDSVNKYAVMVISITNDGESQVTVTVNDTTANYDGNIAKDSLTAGTTIDAGDTVEFTYVAHVKDTAASVDEFVVTLEFDIARTPKA